MYRCVSVLRASEGNWLIDYLLFYEYGQRPFSKIGTIGKPDFEEELANKKQIFDEKVGQFVKKVGQ